MKWLFPRTAKGWLWTIVRMAFVFYAASLILLFFRQEKIIFVPNQLPAAYQFDFHSTFEERWLTVDGQKVDSLLFTVPDPWGVILFFHGNSGDLSGWGAVAEEMADRLKWDVWVVDYPGFGKSEGHVTSEEQLHRMAATLYDSAKSEFSKMKIVSLGRSIGTGIALRLASDHPVDGLILESPYYSLVDVASIKFPWVPTVLLRYPFRSDLWMTNVASPSLIVHGTEDEVIPVKQGERLARLAKKGSLVLIPKAHHNDIDDYPQFWKALEDFLATI